MNKKSVYILNKDSKYKKYNILQITMDAIIFLISLFLIIHNLRNTAFTNIMYPLSLLRIVFFSAIYI